MEIKFDKSIFLLGDVHRQFHKLRKLIRNLNLSDCHLICVGDLGLGMPPKRVEAKHIQLLHQLCEERGITFHSIRGNHDDPAYWENNPYDINLIPDYSIGYYHPYKILLIGGAVSVDRENRVAGTNWWHGEKVQRPQNLHGKFDIFITHSSPASFRPETFPMWKQGDIRMQEDLREEDRILSSVFSNHANLDDGDCYYYYGHFHRSMIRKRDIGGTLLTARGLDILEILPI